MDYGFTHNGAVFTPNGTQGIPAADSDARNREIERTELEAFAAQPERVLAYYDIGKGTVTTWLGTQIGTIITSHAYRHNYGGQFVSLRVRGTNGATYYGRASYDGGNCINLRKVRS